MKKWIALLLTAMMMLSCLAGCGGDNNAANNNNLARKITVQVEGAFLFFVPLPLPKSKWRHLLPLGAEIPR